MTSMGEIQIGSFIPAGFFGPVRLAVLGAWAVGRDYAAEYNSFLRTM